MRFQLPQFIETEVKIVGPFTLKQFLWLAGGAAILTLVYMTTGGAVFFILAIPVGGIFLALAFFKINDIPLLNYVSYGLSYLLTPKKYLFKKEEANSAQQIEQIQQMK
ncbi:MAG: hypothetical protein UU54_C0004G0011 [Candidatus Yanofskybacteria bacterium GW2011_GWA2_41_22]|uniref:PrgI family protein n=4 Tax=Parcubacteria group TaxID=1794811 RepID=A0A1F8HUX8_9BACT|nr:MAG: hypothetical protein UU54_C0004G0011 [Candidatus Yanofskybacteria bacterium GW2011_GWA2_41_22]KKS25765.1 MAG: hypothetical protein UU83_C0002G0013 [Candidatus Jorgensenbacteria bacterium GW2011_GWF2_41_8]KKS27660.1 MAG: hypothetical protein UU84_C0002G0013 [Candidatus Yanofskybacteria bacterium GW2011_GWC2_41_9]OGN08765.1 MAG: hypothetical protein A3C64_02035 [Candidatus Yanofskybacteria bacterium RIFCSPHIGHO2_02_FULL_41_12]OGN41312.1 MAG: hypothetical protein A2606_02240 [Candidatus Ya